MLYWTLKFPENLFDIPVLTLALNTLYLVLLSSLVLIIFSLMFAEASTIENKRNKKINLLIIKEHHVFLHDWPYSQFPLLPSYQLFLLLDYIQFVVFFVKKTLMLSLQIL